MRNIVARPREGERPDRPTTWHLFWALLRGVDGKHRRVVETFHGTKTTAHEYYQRRATGLKAEGPGYVPPTKLTVGAWLAQWLETYGREHLETSTHRSYETRVRRDISPYLGHIELARLSASEVQQWQTELAARGVC